MDGGGDDVGDDHLQGPAKKQRKTEDTRKSLTELQRQVLEKELETYQKLDYVLDKAAEFFSMATFHVTAAPGTAGCSGRCDQ